MPLDRETVAERIRVLRGGVCPRCGSRLFVSHQAGYVACERQYDPTGSLVLNGDGSCCESITSLSLLEQAAARHGLPLPVL